MVYSFLYLHGCPSLSLLEGVCFITGIEIQTQIKNITGLVVVNYLSLFLLWKVFLFLSVMTVLLGIAVCVSSCLSEFKTHHS